MDLICAPSGWAGRAARCWLGTCCRWHCCWRRSPSGPSCSGKPGAMQRGKEPSSSTLTPPHPNLDASKAYHQQQSSCWLVCKATCWSCPLSGFWETGELSCCAIPTRLFGPQIESGALPCAVLEIAPQPVPQFEGRGGGGRGQRAGNAQVAGAAAASSLNQRIVPPELAAAVPCMPGEDETRLAAKE